MTTSCLSAPPSSVVATPQASDAQLLIDSVTDYAIFMLDPAGNVRTWNRGAHAIKGYEAHEIVGKHFSVFYPPEDVEQGRPDLQLKLAAEHGSTADRGWRIRKDGTRFWANIVITALRDPLGSLVGFAKVSRDLTDERATFEALRASEERFRLLVDGVTDYALYMLDPGGHVATWNAGAERVKGYAASQILGQHFSVFFPPDDIAAGKPVRELEIAREHGRFEEESYRVRRNGELFWANVIIAPLRDARGDVVGFAKVTRDLTARRQAEQVERSLQLEQVARAAAEDANRMKDEFIATVSHEIRTPLNAMLGWASMLRGPGMEESIPKGLEIIHRNARAQALLIDDILDVSRIITGKLKIETAPSSLIALVSDAIEVVRPAAIAKEIELCWIPPSVGGQALVDPDRIRQVIWNLLSNAVKFSDGGGTITVELHDRPGSISIRVTDQGHGIEPSFLPHVFERFRQADSSSTRSRGGLGLGLAIVRHIAELHGGTVSVDSPGRGAGSSFEVVLPRVSSTTQMRTGNEPIQAASHLAALHGVRILVVDDDDDARELMHSVLEQAGADVELASNVDAAFDAILFAPPHIVVSDIAMPGEDGYSLSRRLRSLPAEAGGRIPSIAFTAQTRAEDRAHASEAGFTAHLGKPLDPLALIRLITRLVQADRDHSP